MDTQPTEQEKPKVGDLLHNKVTGKVGTFASEIFLNKQRYFYVRGFNSGQMYLARDTEWEEAE